MFKNILTKFIAPTAATYIGSIVAYRQMTKFEKEVIVDEITQQVHYGGILSRRHMTTQSGDSYKVHRDLWHRIEYIPSLYKPQLDAQPGDRVIITGYGLDRPKYFLNRRIVSIHPAEQ